MATPQLLGTDGLNYLVYDYLAEITMSIMARAKAKDPALGYATDFVTGVMKPFARQIDTQGVKVIANAGGINPRSCGEAVRNTIKELGLDLKVAIITGDDLVSKKEQLAATGVTDMFSGTPLPPVENIASINAYIGAFPIAKALTAGADIIITGRCVDSAVTLGACIYEFGWNTEDWDLLASGSLAGHILECGPQATGGNFTDWEKAKNISNIGYPVAEIRSDGSFSVTKPDSTGGLVSIGTVSEQLVYEIGDPQSYILPDVICDFSAVSIEEDGPNQVRVSSAKGRPAPDSYKTCLTYTDGFRAGTYLTFYGTNAEKKAVAFAEAVLTRAKIMSRFFNIGEFSEISTEIIGAGSQFGEAVASPREVIMKFAVKHPDIRGAGMFLKEIAGMGLATPPGLSGFTGIRAKPSPVVRLFSFLTPKREIAVSIDVDGDVQSHTDFSAGTDDKNICRPERPPVPTDASVAVPLVKLAWGRSGDKGDKANIGIIARRPEYLPYIWAALTEDVLKNTFAHFMEPESTVERYYLPGPNAINYLIDRVLGGGGAASLRNDAQGKGYAQILLTQNVQVSEKIAASF